VAIGTIKKQPMRSHTDNWFRTGDAAYLDDEDYLFIVDRIKDMVIRGGENIGCGEVEAAPLEHPSVRETCVFSVPDERFGEEIGATFFVSVLSTKMNYVAFSKATYRYSKYRDISTLLARFCRARAQGKFSNLRFGKQRLNALNDA
tara:strand:+ start:795 stop:1232 length:438 start_codon:yes stop_codon:yes gene_type:complete